MDKSIRQEIKLLSEPLMDDEPTRFHCPACRSTEKTLVITATSGGIKFLCYRASCNIKGIVQDTYRSPLNQTARRSQAREYDYPLQPLNFHQAKWFYHKFNLIRSDITRQGIKYNARWNSYAFAIYDEYGYQVGVVDRSYSGRIPKSISYWFIDTDHKIGYPATGCNLDDNEYHFRSNANDCDLDYQMQMIIKCGCRSKCECESDASADANAPRLYLVEDLVSAMRLQHLVTQQAHSSARVGALLGSSISQGLKGILARKYDEIVLILDPDAIGKAIKLKQQHGSGFKRFHVMFTDKDPKDMSSKELLDFSLTLPV